MSQPLVTVVTVCYNAGTMLSKTMESVGQQSYPNLEYIIVDGGSTDGTQEILRDYKGKLDKFISETDNGIYDAMNKGVQLSSGAWIIFMNAGDTFYDRDTIANIFSDPIPEEVKVVYGDVAKPDSEGSLSIKRAQQPHNSHRMFFCHQSAFARRKSLIEHPFDTRHRLSADFKFFKTLILNGDRFMYVNTPISVFDVTGISNSSRSKGLKDNISVIKELDSLSDKLRLLPRLYFTYLMCRFRGK